MNRQKTLQQRPDRQRGRGRSRGGQLQLGLQQLEILQFAEGWQLLQTRQIEIIQKLSGGGIERGAAGDIAMSDDADPLALLQDFDGVRTDGDTAHGFNVAPRHRLTVGDQHQGFEERARIAPGFFFHRPIQGASSART